MCVKTTFFNAIRKLTLVNKLLSAKGSSWCCSHVPLQLFCCRLLHLRQTWPGASATKRRKSSVMSV